MSDYTWNADAFDAIRIIAANGEFEIVGTKGKEVELEGEEPSHHRFGGDPQVIGRWLELHPFGGGSEWKIGLPTSKAWVIELMSGSGDVQIENVQARIYAQVGSGDIHIENCRGVFNVRSGSGDVVLENCTQTDAPPAPARAAQDEGADVPPTPGMPGMPPIPPIPPIPPVPPIGVKVRVGKKISMEGDEGWDRYGREWEEWGERFAENASHWAEKFSRGFAFAFKFGDDEERADGVHVQLGSGDIQLEDIDAQLVTARIGSGDIHIEQGRIAELDLQASRGDLDIENVLPTSAWELVTRHGDIHLILPGDAFARIDAATRHGEINCDAPLVRVGRPGPGARHGGRMVGTIGESPNAEGAPVDIQLESQHGDIMIDVERRSSRYAGQPAPYKQESAYAGVTQESVAATESSNMDAPPTDLSDTAAASDPPKRKVANTYDSQLAILQALQSGEVTVAEAEMLLKSLNT